MDQQQRKAEVLRILEHTYKGSKSALNSENAFQLLLAVMLSAQTNDNQVNKVTGPLFAQFSTPAEFAALTAAQLEPYISTCGIYKNKAKNIIATAKILVEQYNGEVPADKEQLIKLPGVGGKTANVVLSVGFGIPALAVDTHVFRVANRLHLATANNAEQTEQQLCALIPKEKWGEAHHWLIWHGRKICAAQKPKCNICPLADLCPDKK